MLPWMASKSGPGPRALDTNLSLSLSVLPPGCHLPRACPPLPRPPQPPPTRSSCRPEREIHRGRSTIFQLATGASGVDAAKVRGGGHEEALSVHTGGAHMASLRRKGKSLSLWGKEQPSESPGLAWERKTKLPPRGTLLEEDPNHSQRVSLLYLLSDLVQPQLSVSCLKSLPALVYIPHRQFCLIS